MNEDKQRLMQQEAWLLKEKYNGEETREFTTDCLRLQRGEPLAYVIGHVPFLDCTIYLDSYPLIPRPETEFWVEKVIGEIKGTAAKSPRVLDLCAGSGCIGVAVARAIPSAHVTFSEIDKKHLSTIAKNLKENQIACTEYKIFQSDLFENIEETFDFILTNPPYIDPALNRADDSVKTHEPHLALYGGKEGLELIAKILTETSSHLKTGGKLYLEHEPEQVDALRALANANLLRIHTHKDQYDVSRYSTFTVAQ